VRPDLGVEVGPAPGDGAQAGLGRGGGRGRRPRAQGGRVPDQRRLAAGRFEPLARGRWGAEDERLQRRHGPGPRLHGGIAGHLEVADHLRFAGSGLGQGAGLAAGHGAGGGLGVEGIGPAVPAAQPAVGAADLMDDVAAPAPRRKRAKPAPQEPVPSMPKARMAPRDRARASSSRWPSRPTSIVSSPRRAPSPVMATAAWETGAEPRDGHGGVGVLVGVDADDDAGGCGPAHVASPPVGWRIRRSGGWTGP
jgi:hypothetical protein